MKTKTLIVILVSLAIIAGVWYYHKRRKKPSSKSTETQTSSLSRIIKTPISPAEDPAELQIGGVHCKYYGQGPNGQPLYNCDGVITDRSGHQYGAA